MICFSSGTPQRDSSPTSRFLGRCGTGGLHWSRKGDFPSSVRSQITDKTATQVIALPRTLDSSTVLDPSEIAPLGGEAEHPAKRHSVSGRRWGGLAVQLNDIDKAKLYQATTTRTERTDRRICSPSRDGGMLLNE
jgi:hypothetical protein